MRDSNRLDTARALWDAESSTFDDEPDHGLRSPVVRNEWKRLLRELLPPPPGAVLDAGCGTGSLSILLADLGYEVLGIDISPEMLAKATKKAAAGGLAVAFQVGDAGQPDLPPGELTAVICRHVLWMLPQPETVLRRWGELLMPGGRMVLVEGFWHTGAGLHAKQVVDAMPDFMAETIAVDLTTKPLLWGGPVVDERFAVAAVRRPGV